MEGNKDESNRCAELAKQYFAMGDYEKARKFMTKAHKLFQSDETKKWLEDLSEYSSNNNKENKPSSRSKSPATANNYRRDDEYTSEQKKLVTRVNSCKDYYEVLEVAKDASDSDIKKAYKKIALKLHPDKNKCPGAAEAFKKVGHAVAVLTDCEKRKQYDLCGPDFANKKSHAASNSFRAYEFEQDTNVDEIFNLFFGGGFNRPNVYMRTRAGPNGFFTNTTAFRREHHNHSTDNDGPLTQIMQICPLLFAILISLLLSYLQTPPVFSIKPIGEYNVQYYTPHLKLPFFSKANFQSTFDGSLSALEEKIIYEMKVECQREIQRREQRIFSARLSYDEQAIKEASNFKTPFCDILQRKHVISV